MDNWVHLCRIYDEQRAILCIPSVQLGSHRGFCTRSAAQLHARVKLLGQALKPYFSSLEPKKSGDIARTSDSDSSAA